MSETDWRSWLQPMRSASRSNHAFVDGNKRIAFMAMMVFLARTTSPFAPDPAQATSIILSLAAGEVSEAESDALDQGQLAGLIGVVLRASAPNFGV